MKPVLSAGLLLSWPAWGRHVFAPLAQWLSLVVLLVCGLVVWGRASHWPKKVMEALALMLCLVSARCGDGVFPQPQPGDPSLFIPRDGTSLAVRLVGRIHADGAVNNGRCRSLLEVSSLNGQLSRGRTELTRCWPVVMSDWLCNERGVVCAPMPMRRCGRTGPLWPMHAARSLRV